MNKEYTMCIYLTQTQGVLSKYANGKLNSVKMHLFHKNGWLNGICKNDAFFL